ncbi:hypothetical protein [Streptomyces capitiformicae]|uniref:hypothetical protein n=1 Tax=Streptomyces capitiformicae TaxID=2014920 RepID=UPI0016799150|nr:hypothetical protein [Streptomyces capitiformicae]
MASRLCPATSDGTYCVWVPGVTALVGSHLCGPIDVEEFGELTDALRRTLYL